MRVASDGPFLSGSADRFDEWFHLPIDFVSPDPRVAVRRARPTEFERIYDVVDEAFATKRPRALYDWLYRRNPHGVARCWVVVEEATGRLVATQAGCPWPLASGPRPVAALLSADWVIAADWRGRGINEVRRGARGAHPWDHASVRIGWPNARSRVATRRSSFGDQVHGPIPRAVFPLRPAEYLRRRGWPRRLSAVVGRITDSTLATWTTLRLDRQFGGTIEPIQQFDSGYDAVTERCMLWEGYWLPHDAAFLNWRYFDHPVFEYRGCAAIVDGAPVGYCVVKVGGERAWLAELAAPSTRVAGALVHWAIAVAREAGCTHLTVYAPPRWRHWPLLGRVGFVRASSNLFISLFASSEPDCHDLAGWQFLAGDIDGL